MAAKAPFFRIADSEAFDAGGAVVARLQATRWGTQMIRVHDPDARIAALEAYA